MDERTIQETTIILSDFIFAEVDDHFVWMTPNFCCSVTTLYIYSTTIVLPVNNNTLRKAHLGNWIVNVVSFSSQQKKKY